MKILLLGSQGYLGRAFLTLYPDAQTPRVDIADPVAVAAALDDLKPDIVINAAGKTGRPNVDWCEDHKEETIQSNVTGPLVLLDACAKRGVYWLQMSSGCIYRGDNGGKGWSETDPPNFSGSFYARSKAWIDVMLQEFPVLQLRLRMPFDGSSEPRSLIQKLVKYTRVLDAENSFTYLPDFLSAAHALIDKRVTGTFNVVNPGAMSPYEIMQKYAEIVDPSHRFEKLSVESLGDVVVADRSNCLLSTEKLREQGIALRPVSDAVEEAMQMLAKA